MGRTFDAGLAPFPRSLLAGDVVDAARALLGAHLLAGEVAVRITEVEAYAGPNDPASHAWRGLTTRTALMAGRPGLAYVYFSYGVHWCLNVTSGPVGVASAVLIRAGEVVAGQEVVTLRRPGIARRDWARGPGRLSRVLGIDRSLLGVDLCAAGSAVRLGVGSSTPAPSVVAGPRVGVSRAEDVPWRFWIAGERSVSAYRRSPRAKPPEPVMPAPAAGRLSDRES